MAHKGASPKTIEEQVLAMQRELELDEDGRKVAERQQERNTQLVLGRCNVVPLPKVATRPFRTELTVEQNSLFVSNAFSGESFTRETVIPHPDSGEDVIRRMTVGRVHATARARGVLRQSHQDAFYKVLELWGQDGYPVVEIEGKAHGTLKVSAYELVKAIFASDNVRSYRRTQELLRDLASIPIVLENVYTWQGLRDWEEFSLLADVTWSEKGLKEDGSRSLESKSYVTILLSRLVTEGFLARHIKVLLGKPYDSLSEGKGRRSEIARLLYPFLDAQLATKDSYHAKLDALAERFGLQRYPYRSKRKEKFEPAVRVLEGRPILEGRYVLRVSLHPASDDSDFVLRARREPVGS